MSRVPRISPALVLSALALFVALGTGAYAVSTLPKHSVGTKQLKKKAVGSKQLKKGAVKSKNIKDATIQNKDVKAGTIAADRLAPGVIPAVPQQPIAFAAKHAFGNVPGQGTLISRSINVPRAGFLHLVASGDAELGGDDFVTCSISVDGAVDSASSRLIGAGPGTTDNCGTNTVVQVTGGAHTIAFVGSGADPDVTYDALTLQAIFVPAGSIVDD